MSGRVERGEGRKSRGNQIGQKRRKSLSPFKDPRAPQRGTTSRVNPIHTLESPVCGLVLVPRVTWHHPLVCKGSSQLLRIWKIWDCTGIRLFWARLHGKGGSFQWAAWLFDTPQTAPSTVACKREGTFFRACRCSLSAFNLSFKFSQDSWKHGQEEADQFG